MKPTEAELLLGGYATGNLTPEERQKLFTAALGHQAIFDALMDEEALRELLADPVAKAQLIAALAPAAVPKIVPFWRRTGVLGAAAGLIVAATAGLAYLRSPQPGPSALQEPAKPAEPKAPEAPAPAPTARAKQVAAGAPAQAPAPPPPASESAQAASNALASAPATPVASGLKAKEQDQYRSAEVQDKLAKKAEAPRSSAALLEVAPAPQVDKQKARAEAPNASAGAALGRAVGGVASRTAAADLEERARGDAASLPATPPAKSARPMAPKSDAAQAPTWILDLQPDGTTRVRVKGAAGAQAVLLRRRADTVEVLPLQVVETSRELARWRADVRLIAGDVLDLYLLNAPVGDPAKLPETGPLDGFRARIFPAAK